MKILQINTVCGTGSTGRITTDIYGVIKDQNHECIIAYGRNTAPHEISTIRISSNIGVYYHALLTRITDRTGFYSTKATKKFIRKIETYNPDIIHIHNIHGYYINLEILFEYLSKANKPVVWTLHDCWAFTGHCTYFDCAGCDKWKTKCHHCPQKRVYPKSYILDSSKYNYMQKKRLFTSVENMTLVTPSIWLSELVEKSFLGKYAIRVINNGIDLDIFKPTENDFRKRYNLEDKFIILGVANVWEKRKGLETFFELSKILDARFKVILVGLSEKQLKKLPGNILGFKRTNTIRELAEIYTMADVYINPTTDDNFPTTNIEALACGLPVITYNTGGSGESVDVGCGIIVENGNKAALKKSIENIVENTLNKKNIISRSKMLDKKEKYLEYLDIYKAVLYCKQEEIDQ